MGSGVCYSCKIVHILLKSIQIVYSFSDLLFLFVLGQRTTAHPLRAEGGLQGTWHQPPSWLIAYFCRLFFWNNYWSFFMPNQNDGSMSKQLIIWSKKNFSEWGNGNLHCNHVCFEATWVILLAQKESSCRVTVLLWPPGQGEQPQLQPFRGQRPGQHFLSAID